MYNRYIPQPDGSYRRNSVQEPARPAPQQRQQPQQQQRQSQPQQQSRPCPQEEPVQKTNPPKRREPPRSQKPPVSQQDIGIGNFLKQLLPRDLDTGDLLVIVLLLLMAGDCQEDKNHALLTLVLYLFL